MRNVFSHYFMNYSYENIIGLDFVNYIGFNFVNKKVNITGYAIRKAPRLCEVYFPKTWKIMGSNDEQKWEVIDMKENNNEINDENECVYFECKNTGKFYKYIRYKQIGRFIAIACFEFFGYIEQKFQINRFICRKYNKHKN